jgi:hypothetical protein
MGGYMVGKTVELCIGERAVGRLHGDASRIPKDSFAVHLYESNWLSGDLSYEHCMLSVDQGHPI